MKGWSRGQQPASRFANHVLLFLLLAVLPELSEENGAYYGESSSNYSSSWYQYYYNRHHYSSQSDASPSYVSVPSSNMYGGGQEQPPCESSFQEELTQKLKSKGLFDLRYMATSIQQALITFTDFTDSRLLEPTEEYYCDEKCINRTEEIREAFKAKNNFGQRAPSLYTFAQMPVTGKAFQTRVETPPPPVSVPGYASGNYQSYGGYAAGGLSYVPYSADTYKATHTYGTAGQRWMKATTGENTPMQNLPRYGRSNQLGSYVLNTPNVADVYPTQLFRRDWRLFHRKKRSSYGEEGGTDYIVSCKQAGTEEKPGYHSMCGSCRVIRKLPSHYFPRYLNEVVCGESLCISGGGKCAQQYIAITILRNVRTQQCPRWEPVSMIVSCCCNCLLTGSMSEFLDVFPSK